MVLVLMWLPAHPDCQSTMTPGRIHDALSKGSDLDDENHPSKLVLRTHLPTLPHLMAFIRNLPQYLDQKKVRAASV